MPSNQSENEAQNQVPMDNAIESNPENVKMEIVQSAGSNPVHLGKFVGVLKLKIYLTIFAFPNF